MTSTTTRRTTASGCRIIAAVYQEWPLISDSHQARTALAMWAREQPVIAVDDLDELLELIRCSPAATQDLILHTLIGFAGRGDQLAGRVVLQSMLPCLSHRVHSTRPPRGMQLEEMWQRALVEFWTVLHHPRTQERTQRVAAALRLDTLHALSRHSHRPTDVWDQGDLGYTGCGSDDGSEWRSPASEASPITGDSDLFMRVLVAARRDGVISVKEAQFIVDVCAASPDPNERTLVQAARRMGRPRPGVARQFNRICARLAAARDQLVAELAVEQVAA